MAGKNKKNKSKKILRQAQDKLRKKRKLMRDKKPSKKLKPFGKTQGKKIKKPATARSATIAI